MSSAIEFVTSSARQTVGLGYAIGALLRSGDFLAVCGALGAGKTHLIKGVATGIGVQEDEPVASPTFVLVREYTGRLKLLHIDAYRLSGAAELLALGMTEMIAEPASVIALEWADRAASAVPDYACWIELEHVSIDHRRIRLRWSDSRRLAQLAGAAERARLVSRPVDCGPH